MRKTYIRLLFTSILIISSRAVFAQAATDTTKEDLQIIFTKEEYAASFKGGDEALNKYLTENVDTHDANNGEEGTVIFVVSRKGNIYEVKSLFGNLSFEKSLESALLKSSGLWESAMQNNHHINAYCKLKITFRHKKIETEIQQ
jgi:hypothetical protein